jgi:hypothetical protein
MHGNRLKAVHERVWCAVGSDSVVACYREASAVGVAHSILPQAHVIRLPLLVDLFAVGNLFLTPCATGACCGIEPSTLTPLMPYPPSPTSLGLASL